MLLGIRTAPKEELGCSSVELVYGTSLTVPGNFIASQGPQNDHHSQLQRLRKQVRALVPVPTIQHGTVPASVPNTLQKSKFVFIRRDAHSTPLQRPYEGPFRVIETGTKTFKIDIGGRTEVITIDRLKPAHLDVDGPVPIGSRNHEEDRQGTNIMDLTPTRNTHRTQPPTYSHNAPDLAAKLINCNATCRGYN